MSKNIIQLFVHQYGLLKPDELSQQSFFHELRCQSIQILALMFQCLKLSCTIDFQTNNEASVIDIPIDEKLNYSIYIIDNYLTNNTCLRLSYDNHQGHVIDINNIHNVCIYYDETHDGWCISLSIIRYHDNGDQFTQEKILRLGEIATKGALIFTKVISVIKIQKKNN